MYKLEAPCPLRGRYIKTKKQSGPCNHIYKNDQATLEIEARIAEFFQSHYIRAHKIKITREELEKILKTSRTRCSTLDSEQNKKKRKRT